MAKNTLDTFKKHLGYDGKKVNEEKALEVLDEIGFNATNHLGETPLIVAAYLGRTEILKKIIGKIDDVDFKVEGKQTGSALLEACGQRRLESIKLLVDSGADLEQEDRFRLTPLSKVFTNTFSDPIPCARYLVSKGAKITDKVIEMGTLWNKEKFGEFLKNMEFGFDSSLLKNEERTIPAEKLETGSLLDIEHLHYSVNSKNYFETAKIIWQKLVPKSGQAETVQGELLRAIEKLRDEAQRNGNINFHKDCHGILITYLKQHLVEGNIFEKEIAEEINDDLGKLSKKNSPYLEDDVYDRIINRIVDWYLLNPKQIRHLKNTKLYC